MLNRGKGGLGSGTASALRAGGRSPGKPRVLRCRAPQAAAIGQPPPLREKLSSTAPATLGPAASDFASRPPAGT